MKYRAEIDGLRAVAVLPVILFHGAVSGFSGGFVGVDVFFVISGYLITTILLNDLQNGSFSILKFYERRARRILPALFFVILVCLPFAWRWMLPSQLEDFGASLVSVAFFVSNFFFWQGSGYFDAAAELKPMLHTWSLAVEEQYYIFFPPLLFLVWKWRSKWVLPFFVAGFLTSLCLAQWMTQTNPSASFYLSPTRFWEILAGSICAFILRKNALPNSEIGASVGLLLIALSIAVFTKNTPNPGFWTLVPVGGTALIILFARDGTLVAKALAFGPLVWIGILSYSAYLWHQPLFAFARIRFVSEPEGLFLLSLIIATFALSWFSWKFIEQPFRVTSSFAFTRPAIFSMSGVALTILVAIGFGFSAFNGLPHRPTPAGETFADITALEKSLSPNPGLSFDCAQEELTLTDTCRTSPEPSIALWGDSYAMHLAPALVASPTKLDFIQLTVSSCGPFPGLVVKVDDIYWKDCMAFNDDALQWIARTDHITTVVLSAAFLPTQHQLFKRGDTEVPQGIVHQTLVQSLLSTSRYLRKHGKAVLIVSPPPQNGESLGRCFISQRVMGPSASSCDFAQAEQTKRNQKISAILKEVESEIPVIWFDTFLCHDGICRTALDTISIYRDSGHLSITGSRILGRRVDLMGIVQKEATGAR
jgi:peptidoglycan/LPS O-acetylase OafA/YrhL